jgi:PAS domain S-box-containing protein/diguanylate cyclase (GGDEF)-like protein
MEERHDSSVSAGLPDFHAVFEAAEAAMQITDLDGRLLMANRAFQDLLGYDDAELTGRQIEDLVHSDDRQACALLYRHLAHETAGAMPSGVGTGPRRLLELRFLRRNGRAVWGVLRLSPARESAGGTVVVGAIEDLSERRRLEHQLRYRAQHDDLTGLPNRHGLQDRLQRLLHAGPSGFPEEGARPPFVLLLIGIGRLREIGAAFGSRVREGVIQQVATRLRGVPDETELLARFDEHTFAAILQEMPEDAAVGVAGRMLATLRAPFDVDGQSVDVDVATGIVLVPGNGQSTAAGQANGLLATGRSATLVRHAEIALETAWRTPAGIAVFDEEQERISRRQSDLASQLRRAIGGNELVLHYQPKVDVRSGAVTGVEALVRWAHPDYGLVLPDDFVPVAEDSGVIKPLTRWVLSEALQQASRWQAEGIELPVVVNLSARILHDHYVVEMATDALAEGAIAPGTLGLEVTESAVMLDPSRALSALRRLHDLGVTISLDDFGTGYSSFAYLDQLPASELKIDRSFVQDMVRNPSHFRIVHGTIDIGHDLGLAAVAEGIEDRQTLDALSGLGCDLGQGFYVSPPLPGDEMASWLSSRTG